MTIHSRNILFLIFLLRINNISAFEFSSSNTGAYWFNYEIISEKNKTVKLIRGEKNYDLKDSVYIDPYTYHKNKKYMVIDIGDSAFMYNHNLKKIEFPSTIERIGVMALFHCGDLEEVNLENTLIKKIPYACIAANSKLKEVYLPPTLEVIGEYSISLGKSLSHINFPKTLKEIHSKAFALSQILDNIIIPNSVEKIGDGAFGDCEGLKNIHLSDKLKNIEPSTFNGCSSLENIKLPDSLKSIGEYAFMDCYNLKSIRLPNSLKAIKGYAFLECSSLRVLIIPDSINILEEGVFEQCVSLKSVILPKNLKSIEKFAFNKCILLDSICIPASVNRIGKAAFAYCSNLSNIVFLNTLLSLEQAAFVHTPWLSNKLIGKFVEYSESEEMYIKKISTGSPPINNITATRFKGLRKFITFNYPKVMDNLVSDSILRIEGGTIKTSEWEYFSSSLLKVAIIPATVVEIGCYTFARCENIHTLIIEGDVPPLICDYIVDAKNNVNVYVPNISVKIYKKHSKWKKMKIKPMSELPFLYTSKM